MTKKILFLYIKLLLKFIPSRIKERHFFVVFMASVHNLLKSNFTEIGGHKMFLDSKDSLFLSTWRTYEIFETKLMKKIIKRGDTVLDIGANIGYYTLIFAKSVGREGRVFSFEPDPTNFNLLERNVDTNGYKNVMLAKKAVSDKIGNGSLYISKKSSGEHSLFETKDSSGAIKIEIISLDEYFKDYAGKIDLIKIDTEGAEGGVVRGMDNLLEKNKDLKIVSEFWPLGLKEFGINSGEYLKMLTSYSYKFYDINEPKQIIKLVSVTELLKVYNPEKNNCTNLLCIKQ